MKDNPSTISNPVCHLIALKYRDVSFAVNNFVIYLVKKFSRPNCNTIATFIIMYKNIFEII
jgi:hypothetical protein